MIKKIGWAEPECIIGQPRIQKVEGLYYLYVELKNIKTDEVDLAMPPLIGKATDAYIRAVGEVYGQPLLTIFLDVPNMPGIYDIQVGFSVREGTSPVGESEVRSVAGTRYHVVVGKFHMEEDAISLAEKLRQQERYSCTIVSIIGDHVEKVEHHLDELTGS